MTIDDIRTSIASDESRTLELKKTTGELKDGMRVACAYSYSLSLFEKRNIIC
ncbi:MAG: hypothetical protein K2K58_11110 [Muribaculaceae bacterium]|nr:hypothetical protein [Muribaculaceae bacterium]